MRVFPIVFIAATSGVVSGPAYAGSVLDRVMNENLLVEVTDQAYPPFSYIGDNNEVVGFDIDVAAEFAKRLGVKLRVETPSWAIITAGNWQGRWDICICSMTPTKDRAQVLDFATEYYSTPATIVVNVDDSRVATAADLTGKRVGVEAGSTYEKYLLKELSIEVPGRKSVPVDFPFDEVTAVPYDSEVTAFQDLGLGAGVRLDAIVASLITANERISQSNGKFRTVGGALYGQPTWVAVAKGDPEWEAKIREIFAALAADGTLTAISLKWIGTDITQID